jgi:hypothetical protein
LLRKLQLLLFLKVVSLVVPPLLPRTPQRQLVLLLPRTPQRQLVLQAAVPMLNRL